MIGWTTVATEADATSMARALIEAKLAACVQITGPVTACYRWKGKLQMDTEYRLAVKFPHSHTESLEYWLRTNHPYDSPQWVVVAASSALPEYAQWVDDSIN